MKALQSCFFDVLCCAHFMVLFTAPYTLKLITRILSLVLFYQFLRCTIPADKRMTLQCQFGHTLSIQKSETTTKFRIEYIASTYHSFPVPFITSIVFTSSLLKQLPLSTNHHIAILHSQRHRIGETVPEHLSHFSIIRSFVKSQIPRFELCQNR